MKVVTVIPLKKGSWAQDLTYFSLKDIPNGSIVSIPLRSKKVLGLVISVEDATALKSDIKKMSFNLKKIDEVKERSVFLKEYLDATIETSKYFAANKNNGITALLPATFRENYDALAKLKIKKIKSKAEALALKENIKSEKLLFQASFEDRISYYKILIRGSFADKKSVFIVLPTEHDIKVFEESLSRGIEQFTFSVSGGLSPKKILQKFAEIVTMDHPVLIFGTAPFLSIPRHDIATIVLEHESSNAYRMVARPNFDLRFFAELFATKIKAKFILSDMMLRYESIKRDDGQDMTPLQPLQFRLGFKGEIELSNPNPSTSQKNAFQIFSKETIEDIKTTIAEKKSIFIFSLRKGLATMTVCKDCNTIVSCEKCGAPLVLYSSHQDKKRVFVCNRCEEYKTGDISCENCGSWNLVPLGIGTDTVYEEIEKIFSKDKNKEKVKIFKLDKESAKTARGALKIIAEFEKTPGSVLIGTEMAFFYLRNKVPLSIIASFDSLWSIPSFKMGEKIIQIILSTIGITSGKLIIQTKNETDNSIVAIKSRNLLSFVREELQDREKLNYPPFKRFIKITYRGDKEETTKARRALEEVFKEYNPEIFSAFIAKDKGKYVTNALIKLDPKKWSLSEISRGSAIDENLLAKLMSLPMSFTVLVDPEDLL